MSSYWVNFLSLIWRDLLTTEEYAANVQNAEGLTGNEVRTAKIFLRMMFPSMGKEVRQTIMATSPAQELGARTPHQFDASRPFMPGRAGVGFALRRDELQEEDDGEEILEPATFRELGLSCFPAHVSRKLLGPPQRCTRRGVRHEPF